MLGMVGIGGKPLHCGYREVRCMGMEKGNMAVREVFQFIFLAVAVYSAVKHLMTGN